MASKKRRIVDSDEDDEEGDIKSASKPPRKISIITISSDSDSEDDENVKSVAEPPRKVSIKTDIDDSEEGKYDKGNIEAAPEQPPKHHDEVINDSSSNVDVNEPYKTFQQTIESSDFTIFKPLADLGYFRWIPNGPYKSISEINDTKEIFSQIDISKKPEQLVEISSIQKELPLKFLEPPKISPKVHINKYPFAAPCIASIYVATKFRDVDLNEIDFVLRGSALGILAAGECKRNSSARYLVGLVPGTKTVMVTKFDQYEQDYAAPGFQFERLVKGKKLEDCCDEEIHFDAHMHLMMVDKYKILFLGETDAIDANGDPVEITASSPFWWGTKKMFQIISSGSPKICHGKKEFGDKKEDGKILNEIELLSLSEVIKNSLIQTTAACLEGTLLSNLEIIKNSIDKLQDCDDKLQDYDNMEITFHYDSKQLKLVPFNSRQMFPREDIVKKLLFN